jgi:hypothetical protein
MAQVITSFLHTIGVHGSGKFLESMDKRRKMTIAFVEYTQQLFQIPGIIVFAQFT